MQPHRYVFVGGLHRSGTSLVARMIASLDEVAAITGSGVPEDEGVYLQGAIPHTARHGTPMEFATDPAQHHIEGGPYDSLEVQQRLEADWAPWFAPATWRVEKSPVNMTRMRLYQQLFPRAQFVIVQRHAQFVAAAVAKWMARPESDLVAHWLAAHRIVWNDLDHVHAVLVLRYEDVVAAPLRTLRELAAFLDLPAPMAWPLEPVRDGNRDYPVPGPLPEDLAAGLNEFGYAAGGQVLPHAPIVRHPLRSIRDLVLAEHHWRKATATE